MEVAARIAAAPHVDGVQLFVEGGHGRRTVDDERAVNVDQAVHDEVDTAHQLPGRHRHRPPVAPVCPLAVTALPHRARLRIDTAAGGVGVRVDGHGARGREEGVGAGGEVGIAVGGIGRGVAGCADLVRAAVAVHANGVEMDPDPGSGTGVGQHRAADRGIRVEHEIHPCDDRTRADVDGVLDRGVGAEAQRRAHDADGDRGVDRHQQAERANSAGDRGAASVGSPIAVGAGEVDRDVRRQAARVGADAAAERRIAQVDDRAGGSGSAAGRYRDRAQVGRRRVPVGWLRLDGCAQLVGPDAVAAVGLGERRVVELGRTSPVVTAVDVPLQVANDQLGPSHRLGRRPVILDKPRDRSRPPGLERRRSQVVRREVADDEVDVDGSAVGISELRIARKGGRLQRVLIARDHLDADRPANPACHLD